MYAVSQPALHALVGFWGVFHQQGGAVVGMRTHRLSMGNKGDLLDKGA